MSVQITLDQASLAHLQKQLKLLQDTGKYGLFHALTKVAFKIKTEAQTRLKGQRHIVTSRLVNSIYVQAKNPANVLKDNNKPTYSDKDNKTYSSQLISVGLSDSELAVGSNVSYADAIENGSAAHIIKTGPHAIKNAFGRKGFTIQHPGATIPHPGYKGDSYLDWALHNVNVEQSVAQDMRDAFKFGGGVIPTPRATRPTP